LKGPEKLNLSVSAKRWGYYTWHNVSRPEHWWWRRSGTDGNY